MNQIISWVAVVLVVGFTFLALENWSQIISTV